jgi:hypothetical protein
MNSTAATSYNPLAECKAAFRFAETIKHLVDADRIEAAANIDGVLQHLDRAIAMLTRGPLAATPTAAGPADPWADDDDLEAEADRIFEEDDEDEDEQP